MDAWCTVSPRVQLKGEIHASALPHWFLVCSGTLTVSLENFVLCHDENIKRYRCDRSRCQSLPSVTTICCAPRCT